MSSTFKDRRMGYFSLSINFINQQPTMTAQLFAGLIVLDARVRWDFDSIEYYAISPFFQEVPAGNIAPHYTPRFHDKDGFEGFDPSPTWSHAA